MTKSIKIVAGEGISHPISQANAKQLTFRDTETLYNTLRHEA
jgi:hypothetical protein